MGAEELATIVVKRVIPGENAQKVLCATKPLVGEGYALPLAAIGVVECASCLRIAISIALTIRTQPAPFAILIAADT